MEYLSGSDNTYYSGQGFKNPAFSIRLVKATDDLQQKKIAGRNDPSDDPMDNVKVGTLVSFREGEKTIRGRIFRIMRNEQGLNNFVEIRDKRGNIHKVNVSSVKLLQTPSQNTNLSKTSSPGIFYWNQGQGVKQVNENLLSFNEFCLNSFIERNER